jgi:CHASE2 domain-containing sensor protein
MCEDESTKINSTKTETQKQEKNLDDSNETESFIWSLGKSLVKTLPLIVLALLFAFVFSRSDLITSLEKFTHTIQMRLNQSEEDSRIVIVEIDQESFEQDFQGQTRPLNPQALHRLITVISKGQPCIIGVDIDTGFSEFNKDTFNVEQPWQPYTIWARTTQIKTSKDDEKPLALSVLGSQNLRLNENSGLAYVIKDNKDHLVRQYVRKIDTFEGNLPSFAWAIYQKSAERQCAGMNFPQLDENEPPLYIRYLRGPEEIKRSRVYSSSLLNGDANALADSTIFKDKIVLIGVSYLGEDRHETPLGEMLGVEILANVIETELSGGGIKPPSLLTIILLSIFDGLLLLAIFELVKPWYKAFLISLVTLLVLSFACSFLTYDFSFSYWAFFAPVMFGVLLTEIYDRAKDHLKGEYKKGIKETFAAFKDKLKGKSQSAAEE